MKKLKQILLKERKNKLIEGVVDIPMLFYHKLKGNEADIHEKSTHTKKPDIAEGDEVELIETSDVVAIIKKDGKK